MPDDLPYYNPETCRFVNDEPPPPVHGRELLKWAAASLVVTCVLFGTVVYTVGSPSELWLTLRNKHLAGRLLTIQSRMRHYTTRIDQLSERDSTLYRTLLQAGPIPDHILQMGIGGALPSTPYEVAERGRFALAAHTAQAVDSVARKIALQRESYRHLLELLDQFEQRIPQEPAILPANGPVISHYGMRYHPIYKRSRMHRGIDIRTDTGTPVYATGAGRIVSAGRDGGYGLCVRIKHPATDHETRYAHLSSIPDTLRPGVHVRRGDVIGYSGNTGLSTGPHLHYEVRDGEGEALDPEHFFVPEMTPRHYNDHRPSVSFTSASRDSLSRQQLDARTNGPRR